MPQYSGVVRSITPVTSDDNWAFDAAANEHGRIREVHFGGQTTASGAMHTRHARAASGVGVTAGNVAKLHPLSGGATAADNYIGFQSGWATTQPTLDAGDLWSESWNSHGGLIRVVFDPDVPVYIVGAEQISCRNAVGTDISTYGTIWEEN